MRSDAVVEAVFVRDEMVGAMHSATGWWQGERLRTHSGSAELSLLASGSSYFLMGSYDTVLLACNTLATASRRMSRISRKGAAVLSIGSMCDKYYDDLTKQPLREDLVKVAIAKGLDCFEGKNVWRLVPADEPKRVTGREAISVRWVFM